MGFRWINVIFLICLVYLVWSVCLSFVQFYVFYITLFLWFCDEWGYGRDMMVDRRKYSVNDFVSMDLFLGCMVDRRQIGEWGSGGGVFNV